MTVVSSKEFISNGDKYFDLALEEQVFIKRDDDIFLLIRKNVDDMNIYHDASVYEEILEPDDDFYSAITAEELKKRMHLSIHNFFANSKT